MAQVRTLTGVCAAALSFALASPVFAGPAGSEYLPKIPQSGANSSAGVEHTETSSLPEPQDEEATQQKKSKRDTDGTARSALPVSPASSGDDGSSGSILLSPVVILMVAGVIVIAVGMTMRRRQTRSLKYLAKKHQGQGPPRHARPTPEGEIVGGGDQAS
jgi:hypothetical protein